MKKKPKHREQIERMIVAGHRAGVCDVDGNSVDAGDGRFVAKPKPVRDTRRLRDLSTEDTALKLMQSGWVPTV